MARKYSRKTMQARAERVRRLQKRYAPGLDMCAGNARVTHDVRRVVRPLYLFATKPGALAIRYEVARVHRMLVRGTELEV